MLKIIQENRRIVCSTELQKRLRKIGIKQIGYEKTLERILTEWGFNLPGIEEQDGNVYYGFYQEIEGVIYTHLDINYADALALEILFVTKHNLI